LRNKSYCVYNKQLSKEAYEAFMSKVDLSSAEVVEKLKKEFDGVIQKTPIPKQFLKNCEDVTGNYLKNCQNVKQGLECFDLKDCENVFQCAEGKDITNAFMCNDRVENCYNCVATGIGAYQVRNCAYTWKSANMEYCYLCIDSQDCFGCIGLKNKQYYIFNKPYSKEAYFKKRDEIVETMKQQGEYDQFFPIEFSPFCYEDTLAFDFFGGDHHETQPIRTIPQELAFYEKHGIPLPKKPFQERYQDRLKWMDTSFKENNGVFYGHPEEKNIVEMNEYEGSLH